MRAYRRLLLLLSGLVLKDLLYDLLLLDQERANDSVSDAFGTSRSTVRSGDCSLALGQFFVLLRAKRRNSVDGSSAVTAAGSLGTFLNVMTYETTTWRFDHVNFVAFGTVAVTSHVGYTTILYHVERKEVKKNFHI